MNTPTKSRPQSKPEEVANSLSHGLGLIGAIVGTPFLIYHAVQANHTGYLIGVAVFCTTLILLYLSSTLYHALPFGRAKQVLQVIDHSLIFLLIAGTYTPFTLGILNGGWGWTVFGLIWGLALIGIALKLFDNATRPIFYNTLYLLMGWLILIAIDPLMARLSTTGLLWLLAGGLSYSVGIVFYATDARLRYGHVLWHLFVIGGSLSHYFAVWHAAQPITMP